MRIVAGTHKGRAVKSRKGNSTRPTLERVKESLFSIINPYVEDSSFLDLYSGTGNIAFEALSRGAKRAVMIEKDPEALKIMENLYNIFRLRLKVKLPDDIKERIAGNLQIGSDFSRSERRLISETLSDPTFLAESIFFAYGFIQQWV